MHTHIASLKHSRVLQIHDSNAHMNVIMHYLIGQRQKLGTVYSAIYRRKPDIIIKQHFSLADICFYIAKGKGKGSP